jgi:putative CRISPR-associated protein (TIGR02619 family)
MKYIHIISVGSSIINNYERDIKDPGMPCSGDDYEYKIITTNKHIKDKVFKYICQNPYKASAELNSLKEFIERKQITEVHPIFTKTFKCDLAYKLLKRYLINKCNIIVSSGQPISGYYREKKLNPKTACEYFKNDMIKLKENLIRFINRKKDIKQIKLLINATGGFKTETAILVLVGALTDTKVYYKHEFFQKNIYIPNLLI